MKYTEAKIRRIFIMQMEDGDGIPAEIEKFAEKNKIQRGFCLLIGGIKGKGRLVVGPKNSSSMPPNPMVHVLDGVHEIVAAGTIFPDSSGRPKLHMHASLGRLGKTRTGCVRLGIEIWKTGEIVFFELGAGTASRLRDKTTGFELLNI